MRKLLAILLLLPMISLAQTAAPKKAATKAKPAGPAAVVVTPDKNLRLPSFRPAHSSPFSPEILASLARLPCA
jgi:hypothetical protein